MKLVIEISEEVYKKAKETHDTMCDSVWLGIKNGTPLPKGHGRLGDLDELKKDIQNYHDDCATTSEYTRLGFETAIAVVEDVDTIIEADKAESEGKSCSNCKYWLLDKNNENRKCKYCFEMDEWVTESEEE